jgi:diguanylate cyclase (GGDEF)-like protein
VGSHHNGFAEGKATGSTAEILNLADKISSLYHGNRGTKKKKEVNAVLRARYGIESFQIKKLLDQVADHSIEIMSFFDIDPGSMQPLSEILHEAKEELGKVNISYEELVRELERAKAELKKANEKLSELAFRDGLTGLCNHRYFHEQLEKEVSRAKRYQRELALIMFDIDHFKTFNDTYGHLVGDMVLKETAAITIKTVRKSDIVARYGGEEFAIILPETEMKGVVVLAERLRKQIEAMLLDVDGEKVAVTASFGVTIWEHEMGEIDKTIMISAADKAMYKSKRKGRNTISFVSLSAVIVN